jgi:hypothetical protein
MYSCCRYRSGQAAAGLSALRHRSPAAAARHPRFRQCAQLAGTTAETQAERPAQTSLRLKAVDACHDSSVEPGSFTSIQTRYLRPFSSQRPLLSTSCWFRTRSVPDLVLPERRMNSGCKCPAGQCALRSRVPSRHAKAATAGHQQRRRSRSGKFLEADVSKKQCQRPGVQASEADPATVSG